MFMAVLLTITEIWKYTKGLSVDEWIKKMWYFYTMESYMAVKTKELLRLGIASSFCLKNVVLWFGRRMLLFQLQVHNLSEMKGKGEGQKTHFSWVSSLLKSFSRIPSG